MESELRTILNEPNDEELSTFLKEYQEQVGTFRICLYKQNNTKQHITCREMLTIIVFLLKLWFLIVFLFLSLICTNIG